MINHPYSCTVVVLHGKRLCSILMGIFTYGTQNQFCEKNIGNLTTLLKPFNIGIHLKGIETSLQVGPLFLKKIHFWASYFLKIPSVHKGLKS
jgi:hypothetical protein